VYEYFYTDQKILNGKELHESINVCVANLPDLIIDYPNAKPYSIEII